MELTPIELEAELDKTLRGDQGAAQRIIDHNKALRAQVEAVTKERDKIQTDFRDWLADRDGNFYEQIKELVEHASALTDGLAAATARIEALEEALTMCANYTSVLTRDEPIHKKIKAALAGKEAR